MPFYSMNIFSAYGSSLFFSGGQSIFCLVGIVNLLFSLQIIRLDLLELEYFRWQNKIFSDNSVDAVNETDD